MTHHQLVYTLAVSLNVSKRQAERFLDTFSIIVTECITKGEKVNISGFGTFDLGHRIERNGHNPQTKEPMRIPAMEMPRFRPGSQLKGAVRHKVTL